MRRAAERGGEEERYAPYQHSKLSTASSGKIACPHHTENIDIPCDAVTAHASFESGN
jgi:hypothetical protein